MKQLKHSLRTFLCTPHIAKQENCEKSWQIVVIRQRFFLSKVFYCTVIYIYVLPM